MFDQATALRSEPSLPRIPNAPKIRALDPEAIQKRQKVEAIHVPGFKEATVYAASEKKPERSATEPNQDAVFADPKTGLMGVSDGMGGHANGAEASAAVAKLLPTTFEKRQQELEGMDAEVVAIWLEEQQNKRLEFLSSAKKRAVSQQIQETIQTLLKIDPMIVKRAYALVGAIGKISNEIRDNKEQGVATVNTGFIHTTPDGRRFAIIANVGDSAAFVRDADGKVHQVTEEDSLESYLLDRGVLTPEILQRMREAPKDVFELPGVKLSYEQLQVRTLAAMGHPETPNANLSFVELRTGDELLLLTDGYTKKFVDMKTGAIDTELMAKKMHASRGAGEALDALGAGSKDHNPGYEDDYGGVIAQIRVPQPHLVN